MRPLACILIAAAVFGGLQLYFSARAAYRPDTVGPEEQTQQAVGDFQLELTLTFNAGPDEFAADVSEAAALRVSLGDRVLFERRDPIPAGGTILTDPLPELPARKIELYLVAAQTADPFAAGAEAAAIRVRVLRDGHPLPGAEATLWSEGSGSVRGRVTVDLSPFAVEEHEQ